ncbi:hypothetical protein LSH36_143g05039, partial [Paralvinella palmiformis]
MELAAREACNYIKADVFSNCHDTNNPDGVAVSHYFYRCVNDYCGTLAYYSNNNEERRKTQEVRDLEAVRCTTFAAYSKECANRQIILFW